MMHELCVHLPCAKPSRSVVVRPRGSCKRDSSPQQQTLVFLENEIREVLQISSDPSHEGVQHQQPSYQLSEEPLPVAGKLYNLSSAIYEPTTDCIIFADMFKTVKRLSSSNIVSLVAGSETANGMTDGRGEEARFEYIWGLAADGKGNVYVADGYEHKLDRHIRVLQVSSGKVTTLRVSEPPGGGSWLSLAYDAVLDVLVAATPSAICHVVPYGSAANPLGLAAGTRLVAGQWYEGGNSVDGAGEQARFAAVALLAGANSCVYVLDEAAWIRLADASGNVYTTTILQLDAGYGVGGTFHPAMLPGGDLALCTRKTSSDPIWQFGIAIVCGGGFAPSSEVLAGWRRLRQHDDLASLADLLALPPASSRCNEDGSGGRERVSPIVTVRVVGAGDKAFLVHRSVLVERSEYFQQQLQPGGGFKDSGGAEVSLRDAHPDAFGHLLSYMYGGTLVVPDSLLHPAAELAARLLLPTACTRELQARLLATVDPRSALSELVWAEQYGMTELVPQLKAYLLSHRREVRKAGGLESSLDVLIKHFPELSVDLMTHLL